MHAHPSQVFETGMHPCTHVDVLPSNGCTLAGTRHTLARRSVLAVAAVPELSVLRDLQFGGVGGGDAVAGLHAVALLQLGQSAHQTGIGCVQGCYALLLQTHTKNHS